MDEDPLKDRSDAELLTAVVSRPVAAELMGQFGSLRALLHAETGALLACPGMGRGRVQALRALPELARRYFDESLPCGESIRSPSDTEGFLKARMQHLDHELFCCLFLDNRHRVLRFDELFRGTIDGTSVYPREVVKEALAVQCGGCHPGPQPPEWRRRAQPGGRAHHEAPEIGPRAGRYPAPRSPDHRQWPGYVAGQSRPRVTWR